VKQTAFKIYLLAIPKLFSLLVIVGVELITAFLSLQIRKCRYRLELGVWPQLQTRKVAENPPGKILGDYVCPADRERTIRQILSCWAKKSDYIVAKDRQTFEATKWGQRAIRNNPDRHLYAVLRPTRKENLKRIGNVLLEMEQKAFARVTRNAAKFRCGKH
jgi:hypothetical protein